MPRARAGQFEILEYFGDGSTTEENAIIKLMGNTPYATCDVGRTIQFIQHGRGVRITTTISDVYDTARMLTTNIWEIVGYIILYQLYHTYNFKLEFSEF